MVGNPPSNEHTVASSSTTVPTASTTSDDINPVVEAAQKATSAVKKHVSRPGMDHRPSVRLLRGPYPSFASQSSLPTQSSHNVVPEKSSNAGNSAGWSSIFRKRGAGSNAPSTTAASDSAEKDRLPMVTEESNQAGRKPLMVPKRVAEELAPGIAAQADANEGDTQELAEQALAEHYAAQARAHAEKEERTTGSVGGGIRSLFGRGKHDDDDDHDLYSIENPDEYSSDMVDLLDVVDPEISTLSTLTNVQNSLFIPSFGNMINRRPAYRLSAEPEELRRLQKLKLSLKDASATLKERTQRKINELMQRTPLRRRPSISSQLTDEHYAVLEHGQTLEGWTRQEKDLLDDMVRHSLHSRRAKMKRALKGFGQYVRRPLGLFVTVYATLITLFGAAWVLFLIGWISLGSKRDYVINVVDNILVALFAVMGDGLAPFRAVDTYHMIFIAYYYRKTWKIRRQLGLPELVDPNDLPEHQKGEIDPDADVESLAPRRTVTRTSTGTFAGEYTVLTETQQARLEHHERKFSKSHTFYKPHETATHYAFPLRLLIAIVILLDCHSALQITLGACTWSIPYKQRPFALTTVVLCCSITCNITGGVLIYLGDRRTRKTEVLELIMRRELTSEAIEKIQKQRMKEAEEQGMIDRSTRKRVERQMDEPENEQIKKEWKKVPFLPKILLGKGEDSREPALPHKHRRNHRERKHRSTVSSPTSSTATSKPSIGSRLGLAGPSQVDRVDHAPPPPSEQPVQRQPVPPPMRTQDPRGTRLDRMLRLFRRADLDMS